MKKYLFLIILLMLVTSGFANSYRKYVGQGFSVPYPSCPVSNGYINSVQYATPNNCIEVSNGFATINEYFSGTSYIEVNFQYCYLYKNKWWNYGTSQVTHTVECISNNISISGQSSTMDVGETMNMSYSFANNSYKSYAKITWTSSNYAKATVSSSGVVTAKQAGSVTIYAKSTLGENTASYTITVAGEDPDEIKPTSVKISSELTAYVSENTSIGTTLTPSNASTSYTWHIGNSDIASISGNNLYGKKEGTTTVYCTTSNGLTSNECTVNVKIPEVRDIVCSSEALTLMLGKTDTLKCSTIPIGANQTVTYTSNDNSVVSVNSEGIVKTISAGKTTITIKSPDGVSKNINVFVKDLSTLCVVMRDETKHYYKLKTRPRTYYSGMDFVVETNEETYKYSANTVQKIIWESQKDECKVEQIPGNHNMEIIFENNQIRIRNAKAYSNFRLYTISGFMVLSRTIQKEEETIINTGSLTSGTYIISINGKTQKIIKK